MGLTLVWHSFDIVENHAELAESHVATTATGAIYM